MTRDARHELSARLIKRSERWYEIGDRYFDADYVEKAERAYRLARRFMTAGFTAA